MLWHHRLIAIAVIIGLVGVSALPKHCNPKQSDSMDTPDYCEEPNQPHLGCDNDGQWKTKCGNEKKKLIMDSKLRKYIVRQHNVYRNIVARGDLNLLPTAARMLKMRWDDNLAELAKLAVKRCTIHKLKTSFSTLLASKPGYNAVFTKYPKHQNQDQLKVFQSQMKAWYSQYKYVTLESLRTGKSPKGQEISHFLQLVVGSNDRVGCAIGFLKKGFWNVQLMICLYGCYKRDHKYTYEIGRTPAEGCLCGADTEFRNLCYKYPDFHDCALDDRPGDYTYYDYDDATSYDDQYYEEWPLTTTTKKSANNKTKKPGCLSNLLSLILGFVGRSRPVNMC